MKVILCTRRIWIGAIARGRRDGGWYTSHLQRLSILAEPARWRVLKWRKGWVGSATRASYAFIANISDGLPRWAYGWSCGITDGQDGRARSFEQSRPRPLSFWLHASLTAPEGGTARRRPGRRDRSRERSRLRKKSGRISFREWSGTLHSGDCARSVVGTTR